ncbi:MAG: cytochrome P450 [Acidimicrobiales bacterium]|nr:cytochrome P450 [Acidimicrobiales bacterium]
MAQGLHTEPVIDWATDFDLFDPAFRTDPAPIYKALREQAPVAHTERWGGQWMPTRYADLAEVTADTDHYSSVTVGVTGRKPGEGTLVTAPPITSDPPEHTATRRLLLPAFSPKKIEALTPLTRSIARSLIEELQARGDGLADAADDYARHIPVRVISAMLGVPESDEEQFTDWVVRVLQIGPYDFEVGGQATREILAYFEEKIEQRRADPAPHDDLMQFLLEATYEEAPLSRKHILGTCFLLLVAGIDTTWSSIGSALWHLSTHPADRARLVAEPDLIPTAIEEFLRVYSPVTMARIVKADTTLGGHELHPGDRVLLPFPAANRDPEVFEDPDEVRIDRRINRHAAFGLGVHRCLGSNLARMELLIAVEEWLRAFPTFELQPGAVVEWTGGQVRGPRTVPVRLFGEPG